MAHKDHQKGEVKLFISEAFSKFICEISHLKSQHLSFFTRLNKCHFRDAQQCFSVGFISINDIIFPSSKSFFFVRSFNSIWAQWPFCTRRHNDCIGQKVRSQCEKALFQANSPSGRCEWGAALCQWWSHLYLQELMSFSGGGYGDTDCGAVTLLPEQRHNFQIRAYQAFKTALIAVKCVFNRSLTTAVTCLGDKEETFCSPPQPSANHGGFMIVEYKIGHSEKRSVCPWRVTSTHRIGWLIESPLIVFVCVLLPCLWSHRWEKGSS